MKRKGLNFFFSSYFGFYLKMFLFIFRSKGIYKQHQQQKQQQQCLAPLLQQQNPQEFSTCIITFFDEALPYRIKIPSNRPTLKQFKELLPKKGNYR